MYYWSINYHTQIDDFLITLYKLQLTSAPPNRIMDTEYSIWDTILSTTKNLD